MAANRNSQRGVTLPELLIAMLVFALISSVGVYLLRLTIDGRAQLTEADDSLREWHLARIIIKQDLAQLVDRTVRDEFGTAQSGPFVGGFGFSGRTPVTDETPLAAFVRGGRDNENFQAPRSTLQYVEYILVGTDLVRRTRPYLDDARNQPRLDRVLFREITETEIEFLRGETTRGLEWDTNWPSPGGTAKPQAVRLRFTSPRFGRIEQLFWIGETGVGNPP